MSNRQIDQVGQQRLALAGGFNGMPPGGPPSVAMAKGNHPPTLTEIFNHAATNRDHAKKVLIPAWKYEIAKLRRELSQTRLTYERTALGSVTNARNPQADRKINNRINEIQETLAAAKGLTDRFTLAEKKNQLKQTFNRSAGMGM